MKLLTLALGLIFLGVNALGQDDHGYNIIGKINGLPDGTVFYLIKTKPNGSADTVENAKSKDQKFSFKGVLPLEGEMHFIKIDTAVLKLKPDESGRQRQSWVRLLMDNSTVHLTGDLEVWPKINMQGSVPTDEYNKFIAILSPVTEEYNSEVKASRNDSSRMAHARIKYNQSFIKALDVIHNSYAVPMFILNNKILDLDEKEMAYNKLPEKLKNSFYGKSLNEMNTAHRAGQSIVVGKTLPDFKLKMAKGDSQSIKTIVSQSKFTLIDFWASWCVPCRKDIPNLKKAYETFNDKGFNILSVSVDTDTESWKKALSEENMPWPSGQEQNKESKLIFDIMGIPAHILVNEKAEIIAVDYIKTGGSTGMTKFVKDDKFVKKLRGNDLLAVVEALVKK